MCRLICVPYNGVLVRMQGGVSANTQADLPTVFVRMLGDSANMQADLPTVFVRMLGDSANMQADLPTVFVRML